MDQLAELNRLEDPNLIEVGAQILLAFPRQFIEELAQSVPSLREEGGQEAAPGPRLTVRVNERRERAAAVRGEFGLVQAVMHEHPCELFEANGQVSEVMTRLLVNDFWRCLKDEPDPSSHLFASRFVGLHS